ncbi:MAG TPA: carbon storage regulator CsrA [Candidatus Eisenbergiella merdipullorum]|uniref:Translational regulator CsrA n=1 Tax=Candidatus Eisenbergiella merdipullorum TaxID=2838553 RepID=A0A9D2I7R5_9FIRM|nr:carbon storage regulator CsrA [Candidatus Eisenbergiella merdipullorum]
MLILQRKEKETIVIGGDIRITVLEVGGNSVRLAIEAPQDVQVLREELLTAAQTNRESVVENLSDMEKFLSALKRKDNQGK